MGTDYLLQNGNELREVTDKNFRYTVQIGTLSNDHRSNNVSFL